MKRNNVISDELNPEFVFAMASTELLTGIVSGEINIVALAEKQLSSRGLNLEGAWVGFNKK